MEALERVAGLSIPRLGSLEDMPGALRKVDAAEKMLKSLDALDEAFARLIKVERGIYDQVDEFRGASDEEGGYPQVRGASLGNRGAVIETWAKMTAAERDEMQGQAVARGMRIGALLREAVNAEQLDNDAKECAEYPDMMVDWLRRDGYACVSGPWLTSHTSQAKMLAEHARDNARIRLREAGGVGVGENRYVLPDRYPGECWQAVVIRLGSIADDCEAVVQLCGRLHESGLDVGARFDGALVTRLMSGVRRLADMVGQTEAIA